ncbi:uncharacterized protein LOC114299458 [Camellia sinensis]|uniref:uncharacterized protein LOC114299458 n=1 Tax=Camellia sinensis TaxID=4442 RepID=UPI00103659EE|nr:uncharacterized protein LOC114299458 [Camellia sinensis]
MAVDVDGLAGGLLCIWDPNVFQLTDCYSNRSFILLLGKLQNSFDCVIVNIYAPNDVVSRGKLWETLLILKNSFPKPWCLGSGGDFNEIRNLGERDGTSRRDKGMKEFNDFIDKCEVVDVQMIGRKYTWCNALDGNKWSWIDRFLINLEWIERFKFKLWGLPRVVSDHCPIVLMEDKRDWGPKPFNKEVYGNVASKLQESDYKLNGLDLIAESRPLEEEELKLKRETRNEMWRLSRKLEWEWFQKSRLDWNLKGDRNTRYFHVTATNRQNRNTLNSITKGDLVLEEPSQVKNEVWTHFSKHFTEDRMIRLVLVGDFKSVRLSDSFHRLEEEFTEVEVWAAVRECNGNKAPGPDGFNLMKRFRIVWLKDKEVHESLMCNIIVNDMAIWSAAKPGQSLILLRWKGLGVYYVLLSPVAVNAGLDASFVDASLVSSSQQQLPLVYLQLLFLRISALS